MYVSSKNSEQELYEASNKSMEPPEFSGATKNSMELPLILWSYQELCDCLFTVRILKHRKFQHNKSVQLNTYSLSSTCVHALRMFESFLSKPKNLRLISLTHIVDFHRINSNKNSTSNNPLTHYKDSIATSSS